MQVDLGKNKYEKLFSINRCLKINNDESYTMNSVFTSGNRVDDIGYNTYIGSPNTSSNTIMIKNNIFYGYGDKRRQDSKAKGP